MSSRRRQQGYFFSFVNNLISLGGFGLVLWTISPKAFVLGVGYALFGTGLGSRIGRSLFKLNYNQLELNADFRYAVIQVRDNAESIAFYRGEQTESNRIISALGKAIINQYRLIRSTAIYNAYLGAYTQIQLFIPYILLWTEYFRGDVKFGGIIQASMAFASVMGAFGFFVENFESFANVASNATRLEELSDALSSIRDNRTQVSQKTGAVISVEKASLYVPQSDRLLVKDLSLSVVTNDRILLVGASGTGKTSLLRMLSGLWNSTSGSSHTKGIEEGVIFVPQKPYLFKSTLKELLYYPLSPTDISIEQIQITLQAANLPNLLMQHPDPDEVVEWQKILSVGEQQRIAFARVVLSQAKFAILDEATSALDPSNERVVYESLKQLGMGYISVGHRPSLLEHHSKVLELQGAGQWRMHEAGEYVFDR